MIKPLMVLSMVAALSACGLVPAQAVYEEIRAQERAKAVGTRIPPGTGLPPYDVYQKERSDPKPSAR
jgi:uncharacterized lipoprotein